MNTLPNSDDYTIFHFYNRFHIGDNILNLKFFLYITSILQTKKYKIFYYYNTQWRFNKESTLLSYIDPTVIILKPLEEVPPNGIELWQGHPIHNVNRVLEFERYYELFYKQILTHLHITDTSITTTLWLDEPFLLDIYHSLDKKYKDIDILILNVRGHSGQFDDTQSLNSLARHLHTRFNIVTVENVGGAPSAEHLSLQEIGAISTRAKYIISTCSGPHIPCFNMYTKEYVKKWFIVSKYPYTFKSIDSVNTTNMDTVKQYFDSLQM
jgi:hypothetical protein